MGGGGGGGGGGAGDQRGRWGWEMERQRVRMMKVRTRLLMLQLFSKDGPCGIDGTVRGDELLQGEGGQEAQLGPAIRKAEGVNV